MVWPTRIAVGLGGLALSLTMGTGIASAQPDTSAIINSTCNYPQVMAALSDLSPDLANELSQTPAATAWLKSLVAASPQQRTVMVAQAQAMPGIEQYTPVIMQVANTCNSY
jgi:hemophore-related protein